VCGVARGPRASGALLEPRDAGRGLLGFAEPGEGLRRKTIGHETAPTGAIPVRPDERFSRDSGRTSPRTSALEGAPPGVRAIAAAILKDLDRPVVRASESGEEPAVGFDELAARLSGDGSPSTGRAKLAIALGFLVRKGLVRAEADPDFAWKRPQPAVRRFRITAEGRRFLSRSAPAPEQIA
jgi:hypothetical protein